MDKDHPLASKIGRVYYHRHQASLKVGRWILPNEIVHHVDGDKSNNRPENLEVTTREDHGKIHRKIDYDENGICQTCHKNFIKWNKASRYCSPKCAHVGSRKILERPDRIKLIEEVERTSYLAVGKKYGVSDNAIRKWIKRLEY